MNKTVMITGVSSGLGHALAQYYLKQGATVLGCSRRPPHDLLPEPHFRHVSLDLAKFSEIPHQLQQLFQEITQCDLAILNAGMLSPYGDLHDVSLADCQQVMDVNVWANKILIDWLCQQNFPVTQMAAISSGAGIHGKRGWNAYAISKAALNMLITLYAQEFPQTHFTAVAPGPIETAMQEWLCSLPSDERFPSLDSLKARRHTPQMPTPEVLAPRLAELFSQAPQRVPSGTFLDIRHLPW